MKPVDVYSFFPFFFGQIDDLYFFLSETDYASDTTAFTGLYRKTSCSNMSSVALSKKTFIFIQKESDMNGNVCGVLFPFYSNLA